jgi:hypothetical protein
MEMTPLRRGGSQALTGCCLNSAEVPCIYRLGSDLAVRLMEECGLSLAEIGRQLGVTISERGHCFLVEL